MLDFLLADANTAFSTALALMLIIGIFEGLGTVLGFGIGNMLDSLIPDFEAPGHLDVADVGSHSALSRFLAWLRVGKVPILMLLVIWLLAFACAGYLLNYLSLSSFGFLLPGVVTVPASILLVLPVVRIGAAGLEAVLPGDETLSVSLDSLLGREAVITLGQASSGQAAEARVRDQHGKTHYLMVRAEEGLGPFGPGEPLLLVRRQGNDFIVIEAAATAG